MPPPPSIHSPQVSRAPSLDIQPQQDTSPSPQRPAGKKHATDARLSGLASRAPEAQPPSLARRAVNAFGLAKLEKPADIEAGTVAAEPPSTRSAVGATLSSYKPTATTTEAALLRDLQRAIGECRERPVDREQAAQLVNGLRLQRKDASVSNSTLMSAAANRSDDWYRAQGLNDADIKQLHHAAFVSGMISPSAGLVSNLLQFFASPFLSAWTGKPWAGTGLGLGVAGALQTPMYAAQQPVVVQFVEHTAERNGPVVQVDKDHVHHKEWLPDIARKASAQAETLNRCGDEFSERLNAVMGKISGGANDKVDGKDDDARVAAWLEANPTDPDAVRLRESAQAFSDALTSLRDLHEGVLMTQAGHTRQHIGNRFQSVSRVMRPVFQSLMGLASGTPKDVAATMAANLVQRVARLDSKTIAIIQAFGALALTGAQHVSAGYDEVAKVNYKSALNLIYGDFFTAAGNAKIAAGEPITEADIDEDKLRGLIASPAQSLVKRVGKSLDDVIKRTEAERDAAPVGSEQRKTLETTLNTMNADKQKLKDNDLAGLSANGHARATLVSNADALLPGVWRDSKRNLNRDEVQTQVAQRLGQTWHMGAFGSFASSSIGRVAAAVAGGSSKLKTSYIGAFSGLGAGLGAIAAYSQGTTTTIKNHGKEADDKLSLGQQTLYGVLALPIDLQGRALAAEANGQAATTIRSVERQIAMAKVVLDQKT
ncbi:hypothetical protein [Cupriavidus pampae]|uniref:Type III effector protein n=1 Tax=Cupriavidus pampae TaxID=659251 RepID=A0ABN7YJU8_9BURK|nr:hypothetical protein [Cupriavidus pampae]CAG9173298.1 hypothetical protein LMG32289_02826 [Cupriavidus pampae]